MNEEGTGMGLDLVEFLLAVEERFGVRIPDEEAADLTTPGRLIDYLAGRSAPCHCQRVFYGLRRSLLARFGAARGAVRPKSPLEGLIPRQDRRAAWAGLQEDLAAPQWPGLVLPGRLLAALWASALAAGLVVLGLGLGPLLALGALVTALLGLGLLTRPWAIAFPRGSGSVGALVRFVTPLTPPPAEGVGVRWPRRHVRRAVHQLIVEHLGITDYTEDSRWGEDLRID